MGKVTLGPFLGMRPKYSDENLADGEAALCTNFDLDQGKLVPVRVTAPTGKSVNNLTQGLYWYNRKALGGQGFWFSFHKPVNVVQGPVEDDINQRVYMTGGGHAMPRYTHLGIATQGSPPYPSQTRILGLPVPPKLTAIGPSGSPPLGGQSIPTSYVVTYVSDMGEEGPTSEPSNTVERWDGGAVTLNGFSYPVGEFDVVAYRIYRAELAGVFQFVAEIPAMQPLGNVILFPVTQSATTVDLKAMYETSNPPAVAGDVVRFVLGQGVILMGGTVTSNILSAGDPINPHPYEWSDAIPEVDEPAVKNTGWAIGVTVEIEFLAGSRIHSRGGRPSDEGFNNGFGRGGAGAGMPVAEWTGYGSAYGVTPASDMIGGNGGGYQYSGFGANGALWKHHKALKGADALRTDTPTRLINPVIYAGGHGGGPKGGDVGDGIAIDGASQVQVVGVSDIRGTQVAGPLPPATFGAGGGLTSAYSDTLVTEKLGEAVPSAEWVAPNPNMVGLVGMPNGVLAGFFGNTVAFSEPYQPHAWPIRYRLNLGLEVVALAVSAQGLVVATTSKPALVVGAHPASLQAHRLEIDGGCVSARSMVDMGAFVLYASGDGLVMIGAESRLITDGFVTPEQWRQKYANGNLVAVRYHEEYLGFNGPLCFAFSPAGGFREFALPFIHTQAGYPPAVFQDDIGGDVYLKQGLPAPEPTLADPTPSIPLNFPIVKFGAGAVLNDANPLHFSVYRSKTFVIQPLERMTSLKLDADYTMEAGGQVVVRFAYKLFSGAWAHKDYAVPASQFNKSFRLPTTMAYSRFYVEVLSKGVTINNIHISTSNTEIA